MPEKKNEIVNLSEQAKIIPPELLAKFLENQAKEIEIRAQELTLKKQEDDHGFEYGKMVLSAKVGHLDAQKKHEFRMKKASYAFISFISILVVIFLVYALRLGKEAIAIEVIKGILYVLTGGIGGYAFGKIKKDSQKEKQESNPS